MFALVSRHFFGDKIQKLVQWKLRGLRPPFLSDPFSKKPKVSKSDLYVWNLL